MPWPTSPSWDSSARMRVLERSGIAVGILVLVALPTALHGWPTTLRGNLFTLVVLSAGLALMWWRSHPRASPVLALGLLLHALAIGGGWFPDTAVAIYSLSFALLALAWSGRAAGSEVDDRREREGDGLERRRGRRIGGATGGASRGFARAR